MKTIVQKYGGTSMGSVERIQAIAQRTAQHFSLPRTRPALVVSAMSGETNRLASLAQQTNPTCTRKSYDMIVSAGEQVSVGLLCAALEGQGLQAEPLLAYQLGLKTDSAHSKARIQTINTQVLEDCWNQSKIPVIAGFQGVTETMEVTTLGRGGSDTTAVAIAAALKADLCEINTDVDGVYTADPRYVPSARLIEWLSYDLALEMAALGSKVLHSRCVEIAAKFQIPLTVRNSFKDEQAKRSRIMQFSDDQIIESPVVAGISLDLNVAKITVSGLAAEPSSVAMLFECLAAHKVNVDIIVHDLNAPGSLTGFTVSQESVPDAMRAMSSLQKDSRYSKLQAHVSDQVCKVSAVGLGMSTQAGVARTFFSSLTEQDIPILMVSTSEIKISCIVPRADGERAAQTLHRAFLET